MRICFLLERQYAPYPKWFGTAFARLETHAEIAPLVTGLLDARDARSRDDALSALLERLAVLQNASGLARVEDPRSRQFFERPFRVIDGLRFARALIAGIEGDEVRRLSTQRLIGGIDHITTSTDLLEDATRRKALRALYL